MYEFKVQETQTIDKNPDRKGQALAQLKKNVDQAILSNWSNLVEASDRRDQNLVAAAHVDNDIGYQEIRTRKREPKSASS